MRGRAAAKGFVELSLPDAPTGEKARGLSPAPEVVVSSGRLRIELSGSSAELLVARVVAALTGGS